MAETPIGEARNDAIAIVTALLDGDDETAWAIARSDYPDTPTITIILARVVASNTTPEAWRQMALNIANGR